MEAASKYNFPVIIKASNDGSKFLTGKSISDKKACAADVVSLDIHVRVMVPYYGIPVILHLDHCAKNPTPWFKGLLEGNIAYFSQHGHPIFSSHILDLSKEPDDENIAICVQCFKRMNPVKMWLEMELTLLGERMMGWITRTRIRTSFPPALSKCEMCTKHSVQFPTCSLLPLYLAMFMGCCVL